ncbi:hypothetical protein HELRODRAFT_188291 [Helobdella robusta]|uniref:Uncharacterized protein n=1 Tax=Helobdella robusta TaxID=6412 RepID=T1FPU2_HELRO|nr:hypothetical protein HELRODRAFT_188291 [Helobdella robusta]ESO06183.1 hypothetical protein HELRODRAFT_188291 [Helobdella robusta]
MTSFVLNDDVGNYNKSNEEDDVCNEEDDEVDDVNGEDEDKEEEFSMTCYLRQVWTDSRLAYKDYNKSITLNYNQFDRLWIPDLFIRNLKSGRLHAITLPNRLIRLSPDGTVLYSQRLSMTLVCNMVLDRYPMDNQTCFIEFGSYAYTTDDLIFNWRINQSAVEMPETVSLPEYNIVKVTSIVCSTNFNSTGSFPCLKANFHLNRRLRAYMLTTYLPSFLVVLLSWLSFWIDPESTPARTSLSILTILTVTTQSSSLMRNTPTGSFTKAIDVWMATCLVFVFAAFIEYSIVNTLSRKKKKILSSNTVEPVKDVNSTLEQSAKNVLKSGSDHAIIKNKSFSNGIEHVSRTPADMFQTKSTKDNLFGSGWTKVKQYLQGHYNDEPAVFVELISRIFFPSLFFIFNIVYWPFYLTRSST